jgi:hypothetical protein
MPPETASDNLGAVDTRTRAVTERINREREVHDKAWETKMRRTMGGICGG